MVESKGAGRGRGKFTAKGVQAAVEDRLSAIEDYLAGLIEDGTLPEPEVEAPEGTEPEA
jgi:hypothetical protein